MLHVLVGSDKQCLMVNSPVASIEWSWLRCDSALVLVHYSRAKAYLRNQSRLSNQLEVDGLASWARGSWQCRVTAESDLEARSFKAFTSLGWATGQSASKSRGKQRQDSEKIVYEAYAWDMSCRSSRAVF
jgi:hypothetical protein